MLEEPDTGEGSERALRGDRKIKRKYLWDGEECLPGRVIFLERASLFECSHSKSVMFKWKTCRLLMLA